MARRRGLGEDDGKFTVLCYFTRIFSSGMDEAKSFTTEPDAMKFAKKCVKDSKNLNPHAIVSNPYAGFNRTVSLTRTRRLQVKKNPF
jgi:hypothetical protein